MLPLWTAVTHGRSSVRCQPQSFQTNRHSMADVVIIQQVTFISHKISWDPFQAGPNWQPKYIQIPGQVSHSSTTCQLLLHMSATDHISYCSITCQPLLHYMSVTAPHVKHCSTICQSLLHMSSTLLHMSVTASPPQPLVQMSFTAPPHVSYYSTCQPLLHISASAPQQLPNLQPNKILRARVTRPGPKQTKTLKQLYSM